MKIFYWSKFAKQYKRLPKKVKDLAEKREEVFRKDPFHASLNTHKLKGSFKGFWSFSINYQYRIIFEFVEKEVVRFYAIGTHEIYYD